MLEYFAGGQITLTEREGAIVLFIWAAYFVLPVYLTILMVGYIERQKLVIKPLFRNIFLSSIPTAFLAMATLAIVGSDSESDNSLTPIFLAIVLAALAAGILSILVILMQSYRGNFQLQPKTKKVFQLIVISIILMVIASAAYINTDRVLKDRRRTKYEICMVEQFGPGDYGNILHEECSHLLRKDWGF